MAGIQMEEIDSFGTVLNMGVRCSRNGFRVYAWYIGKHPLSEKVTGPVDPEQAFKERDFVMAFWGNHYMPTASWDLEETSEAWDTAVMELTMHLTDKSREDINKEIDEWETSLITTFVSDIMTRINMLNWVMSDSNQWSNFHLEPFHQYAKGKGKGPVLRGLIDALQGKSSNGSKGK